MITYRDLGFDDIDLEIAYIQSSVWQVSAYTYMYMNLFYLVTL